MDLRKIYEEFMQLQAAMAEDFTPEAVTAEVEKDHAAAPELAAQLEWDDAAAAHRHRVAQVRALMRTVTIQIAPLDGDDAERTRAFFAVRRGPGGGHQYTWRPLAAVLASDEDRARVLADFERQIRGCLITVRSIDPAGARAVLRRIADEIGGAEDGPARAG